MMIRSTIQWIAAFLLLREYQHDDTIQWIAAPKLTEIVHDDTIKWIAAFLLREYQHASIVLVYTLVPGTSVV